MARPLKVDFPRFKGKQIQLKDCIEEYQDLPSKYGFLKNLGSAGNIVVDRRTVNDEELITRGHRLDYFGYLRNAVYSLKNACKEQTNSNLVKDISTSFEAFEIIKQYSLCSTN